MSEDENPPEFGTCDRSESRHAESLGSEEFAESFKASFRTLWLIAVGIVGEPSLAEDVVQEAAIVALAKLDQYTPGTNFRAWMGRIVRFVAMNQVRKEKKRRPAGGDSAALAQLASDCDSSVADHTQYGAMDEKLVAAMDQLGDIARSCLLLRTISSMPYAEIAKLLEIPEGTAMSHVHRTRHILRDRLADPTRRSPNDRRADA